MKTTRGLVLGTALLALAACASSDPDEMAAKEDMAATEDMAKKTELDAGADSALSELYAEDAGARTVAEQAKGIAIFPNIVKGGLGIGAESGDGVLRVGGQTVDYYNVSSASIGLQAGGQSYSQVLLFLTDEALASFRDSAGWEAGVDGSIAVIDMGRSGALDTTNFSEPVVGYIFGEEGLMASASLEGSKYTKLDL